MWQRECRLTRADKCFLGSEGESTKIGMRSFSEEKPSLAGGYKFQRSKLGQYVESSPLLKAARAGALGSWNTLSGVLTPSFVQNALGQSAYDAAQQTRALGAARGMATTNQNLAQEVLARKDAQLNTLGQIQGLQTGGLNQLLGVQGANVGTFSQLNNPILAYLGNLFGGNQQAQIAQAGINAQANAASDAKTSDLIGGAISSVGSIAGAAALSDERLKTKIKETGIVTEKGVPWKTFEYITRPGVKFIGAMAQDVEAKDPESVRTDPVTGIKTVGFKYFPIQLTKEAA